MKKETSHTLNSVALVGKILDIIVCENNDRIVVLNLGDEVIEATVAHELGTMLVNSFMRGHSVGIKGCLKRDSDNNIFVRATKVTYIDPKGKEA